MGGDTNTQSLLQGGVGNEGRTPEEVAGDGTKGIKGREGCDNDVKRRDKGEQGYYGGSVRYGAYGGKQLVNGRGPAPPQIFFRLSHTVIKNPPPIYISYIYICIQYK